MAQDPVVYKDTYGLDSDATASSAAVGLNSTSRAELAGSVAKFGTLDQSAVLYTETRGEENPWATAK